MLQMRSCACLTNIMHGRPQWPQKMSLYMLFSWGNLELGRGMYTSFTNSLSPVLSTGWGLPTQASFSSEGLPAPTVNWARFPNCAFSISSNGRDRSKVYPLHPTESTW